MGCAGGGPIAQALGGADLARSIDFAGERGVAAREDAEFGGSAEWRVRTGD